MRERVVCPVCSGFGEVDAPVTTVDQHVQDRARPADERSRGDSNHKHTGRVPHNGHDELAPADDVRDTDHRAAADDAKDVPSLDDEATRSRLEAAEDRDHAAELRDRGAEGRDLQARMREVLHDDIEGAEDILLRAGRDRAKAADDRARAAADRVRAAAERNEAAQVRRHALRAQREVQHGLALAASDELTGALTRSFGLTGLSHEVDRAGRLGGQLVLAAIDLDHVDEIEQVNDQAGADKILRFVGDSLKANIRSYDLIVRYRENTFLCAMPSVSRRKATRRLTTVAALLTAADVRYAITFGVAEYRPADELPQLISRADDDLVKARHAGGRE